jgi:phage terminase large subunit GpA-like protein
MNFSDLLRSMEIATLRRLCEVPEELTVSEWADRYRILPESSTASGEFRTSVIPYARRWMDLLADPSTEMAVLCWGSQLGKSTVLENAIAYRICRVPSPIMLVRPKIEDAEWWVKKRFVPMVRQTPALAERVILRRSTNSEENSATLRMKSFPGGFFFVASATSASELASWSNDFLALDEVDRMEVIKGEGNPVEIALRRQGATDVATAVLTSTPGHAETTIIWPYLEAGTHELYHVPCPHCGFMQALRWGGPNQSFGLKWPAGKPAEAYYLCEACAAVIEHDAKPAMLAAGEWIATNPEGKYPSSHLNALYSPFAKTSWAAMAEKWEQVHGKPADLQVFTNTFLAECWSETVSKVEVSELEGRLDDALEEGAVPAGVGVLTMGVDVQKPYLYWAVWGWGAGLESWLVATGICEGDPESEPGSPGSPWNALDDIMRQGFRHVNGRLVPIRRSFVDSGYATSKVYRYTKRRAGWQMFASKGVGGDGIFVGKPTVQGRDRVPLYAVRVDKGKDEFLRSQILERTIGPGFVHLPAWLSPEQLGGLVAEERRRRPGPRGKIWYEWVAKRGAPPNEPLDCRIAARAALESLGAKLIAGLGLIAERLATPPAGPAPPQDATEAILAPKPRPPRRGGWMTGMLR